MLTWRNHLGLFFVDIKKIYDKTWLYGILKDLLNLDFCGNLPVFMKNCLHLRHFQVRIGSAFSFFYFQEEGVPQDSIVSVVLSSLEINDILKSVASHCPWLSLY